MIINLINTNVSDLISLKELTFSARGEFKTITEERSAPHVRSEAHELFCA